MDFPTYQPEIDTVILLNLNDKTLLAWLLDNKYIRGIFKKVLNDFMEKYVHYDNRKISMVENKPSKVVDGILHYVTKTFEEMIYFISQEDEEKLADFAVSLIQYPDIVKMIINYLNDRSLYIRIFNKLIPDRVEYKNVTATTEDLMIFFSLGLRILIGIS